jgi:hypothetical protein
MKITLLALFFSSAALCGTAAHCKPSTDLSALDDETRALVMKEKMRASSFKTDNSQANQGNDYTGPIKRKKAILIDGGISTGCDINIGNTKSKPGANTQPTTVIITGPVIQLPGKGCN